MPDGSILKSSHIGLLNFPHLPDSALVAHIFPGLRKSLISIAKLCDFGLTCTFSASHLTILNGEDVLLKIQKPFSSPMWKVNLDDPSKPLDLDPDVHSCGAVLQPSDMSTKQLVEFYHACLFSPAISTMLLAADLGFLDSFPGLTPEAIRRFAPNPVATPKGHLNQKRQGLRSTKLTTSPVLQPTSDSPSSTPIFNPKSNNLNKLFHRIESKVVVVPSRQNSTDLTGRFPISSAVGTNYVLIMFCQDINYIHAFYYNSVFSYSVGETQCTCKQVSIQS